MTRITKTLITVLATSAVTVAFGSSALAAERGTRGDAAFAPTPDAIVGGGERSSKPVQFAATPDAIVGGSASEPLVAASTPSAGASGGFDWGAALVGAGVALGLILAMASMLAMARRRTRVEPSV